ncbi:MAG: PIN domain-containing protein [Thermoproteales archaeon]|nr:PIN domain-containing protein [Thermoproteales archaeon]RLE64465.1 MAG: PIN domain nuclease [Thermoprotei archaeon]
MKYIDTSIIIAALDSEDPRWRASRRILDGEEDKVVSELTLLELASVLNRRENLVIALSRKLHLEKRKVILAVLMYILRRFKLQYIRLNGLSILPGIGAIYLPMASAISMSADAKLKTLDLLHIAYMKVLKERGIPVTKLITADEDFMKVSHLLERDMGIEVIMVE